VTEAVENTSLSWRWSDETAGDEQAQVMLREVREAVFDSVRVWSALAGGADDAWG
jgi:hypothetical protein